MRKAVSFDLDGTLLGDDMLESFIPRYFEKLSIIHSNGKSAFPSDRL
jgi:hydroxymethylpyrimidine pyrophosphatase-like HAD family hydrolase